MGKCFFCSAPCGGPLFCHGCQHYVCEACECATELEERPEGKHEVESHKLGLGALAEGALLARGTA